MSSAFPINDVSQAALGDRLIGASPVPMMLDLGGTVSANAACRARIGGDPLVARLRSALDAAKRGQTPPPVPIAGRAADGMTLWYEAACSPVHDAGGMAVGALAVFVPVAPDFAHATAQLRQTSAALATVIETVPALIYMKDREGRLELANSRTLAVIGKPWAAVEGRTDAEFIDDAAQAAAVMANDRRVMSEGETMVMEERVDTPDGAHRVWLSTKTPVFDDSGAVVGLLGTSVDITERQENEQRIRGLMREISHRSKNMLAIIQAIAKQTGRGTTEISDFIERFNQRLQGLATSQDLLVDSDWHSVAIGALVRRHLAPYAEIDGTRAALSGPELAVTAEAAQAIGLSLHELATNAARHGALSAPGGSLTVDWAIETDTAGGRHVAILWRERGGPAVASPSRVGFGRTVSERMIVQSLGGSVASDFAADGLTWRARFPASILVSRAR